jgi:hypothetical protein
MKTVEQAIDGIIRETETGKLSSRNHEIYLRYYGFDGRGGCSMEEAGSPYGLTRESVRQILNRTKKSLGDNTQVISSLEAASSFIRENLPAAAEVIEKSLRDAKLIGRDVGVEQVLLASQMFGKTSCPGKIVKLHEGRFVVSMNGDQESLPKKILHKATQETSHNGAVHLDMLLEEAAEIRASHRLEFVRAVVASIPESSWIKAKDGEWAYFGNRGRNRLLRRLYKMFSYFKEISSENLREAIERSWAKDRKEYSAVLPDDVLMAICDLEAGVSVDLRKGLIHVTGEQVETEPLREFELNVADFIKSQDAFEAREKEIEDHIVGSNEKAKFSFSMALNHSPLIVRKSRGCYQLAGVPK